MQWRGIILRNLDGRSEFTWLQDLEAAAPDITLEMEALARAGGGAPYKGGSGEMSTVYDATQGWGTMRLRYMGRWVEQRWGRTCFVVIFDVFEGASTASLCFLLLLAPYPPPPPLFHVSPSVS